MNGVPTGPAEDLNPEAAADRDPCLALVDLCAFAARRLTEGGKPETARVILSDHLALAGGTLDFVAEIVADARLTAKAIACAATLPNLLSGHKQTEMLPLFAQGLSTAAIAERLELPTAACQMGSPVDLTRENLKRTWQVPDDAALSALLQRMYDKEILTAAGATRPAHGSVSQPAEGPKW